MSNVWLLITIWGMTGSPVVQQVPYHDMEACELAAQSLSDKMVEPWIEEWNQFRQVYPDEHRPLILEQLRKPGGTFVCTRTSKPWVDEQK